MKIVVTGAQGQLGWELARSLLPLGEVVALTRQQCDLSRPETLAGCLGALAPDLIVNAAAYTAVDRAEQEEVLAHTINATAVGELGQIARRLGALLLHYSTDYVFDGTLARPYREDDPPCPLNAYGRSKLAGEQALVQEGGDYLILRTAWVYAARGRNFLRTMLRLGSEREHLGVVADQFGAPTWARNLGDVTAQIAALSAQARENGSFSPGLYHLCSAGRTSWHGFAEAIFAGARARGLPLRLQTLQAIGTADYPTPARRPANACLETTRLRERFGLTLPDWSTALRLCLDEFADAAAACPQVAS